MSFEEDVTAKYMGVFGGRFWWDVIPEDLTAEQRAEPFCIVQRVGGVSRRYVDNTRSDMLNARLQFFVWGEYRVAVSNKMRELADAIALSSTSDFVTIELGEAQGDFNEVLKLRGERQDFGFWYQNPSPAPP